jgi:taurine dioxygenase
MVYIQEQTGRPVLNLSPWFAEGIEGMETEEGDALLHEVVQHCISSDQAYFHQWQPDDMVLWDNWRMLHCATGIPPDGSRHMQRTTIAGDYALGRLEVDGPKVGDGLVFSV